MTSPASLEQTDRYALHRDASERWGGWLAHGILLDDESPEELQNFRKHWERVLAPQAGLVSVVFDYLTVSAWRLRRIPRIEADLCNYYARQSPATSLGLGAALVGGTSSPHWLPQLGRYESGLRRTFFACLELLRSWRINNFFPYLCPPFLPDAAFWATLGINHAPNDGALAPAAPVPALNEPAPTVCPRHTEPGSARDSIRSAGAGRPIFRGQGPDWRAWLDQRILVDHESAETFEAFRREFRQQLHLRPGLVYSLYDDLVILLWRLHRTACAEAFVFNYYMRQNRGQGMGLGAALVASIEGNQFLLHLSRFESGLRRYFFRELKLLLEFELQNRFPYRPDPVLDPGWDLEDYLPPGFKEEESETWNRLLRKRPGQVGSSVGSTSGTTLVAPPGELGDAPNSTTTNRSSSGSELPPPAEPPSSTLAPRPTGPGSANMAMSKDPEPQPNTPLTPAHLQAAACPAREDKK